MPILRTVKELLIATGLYERFEFSTAHRAYLAARWPEVRRAARRHREDHRHFVRAGELVFDLGANVGDMTECYLSLGARVVAVEPDERCLGILRRRFERNPRFSLVSAAVSDAVGTVELHVVARGSAYNSLSDKWRATLESGSSLHAPGGMRFTSHRSVPSITLDELIRRFGVPNYVKVDVEGHEISVLRGLSRAVPLLMFEANLPEFCEETLACLDHLRNLDPSAGFQVVANGSGLRSSDWLSLADASASVRDTPHRSVDIYCKSPLRSPRD